MASVIPVTNRRPRFIFGGLSAMTATLFTHPADLLKVRIQTKMRSAAPGERVLIQTIREVVHSGGIRAFWDGISGGLLREGTYSTVRFGAFILFKEQYAQNNGGKTPSSLMTVAMAMLSGAIGGVIGNPADLVNVRLNADRGLPLEKRRNYRHALDGLVRVWREEGMRTLMNGVSMNAFRAVMLTGGQIGTYDCVKQTVLSEFGWGDTKLTHFFCSMVAGLVGVTACSPADVVKTRTMNAAQGQYNGMLDCAMQVARRDGARGFFKGWLPAYTRFGPQTVITFLVLEQLTLRFGYVNETEPK